MAEVVACQCTQENWEHNSVYPIRLEILFIISTKECTHDKGYRSCYSWGWCTEHSSICKTKCGQVLSLINYCLQFSNSENQSALLLICDSNFSLLPFLICLREGPLLVVASGRDTASIAAAVKRLASRDTFVIQVYQTLTDLNRLYLLDILIGSKLN